jgi:DNA-binding CsgD family transcriptional regulator
VHARSEPLMDGHQNKTAAAKLGISVHTVGFHISVRF